MKKNNFIVIIILTTVSILGVSFASCPTKMDYLNNSNLNEEKINSSSSYSFTGIIASFDNFNNNNNIGGSNSTYSDADCNIHLTYSTTCYNTAPYSAKLHYLVVPNKWGTVCVIDFGGAKDFSAYSKFIISVKGGDISTDNPHRIKLECSDLTDSGYNHRTPFIPDDTVEKTPITHSNFTTYTIPFTAFNGTPYIFCPINLTTLSFVFKSAEISTDIGTVYIDDIRVE